MLIKVVRESPIGFAVPSRIYIDGVFFCYGLENESYMIPTGTYSAYGMTSPKFGTNKVYLNVPSRSAILFHGGNNHEQSKGCIIVGLNRDNDTVSGDVSDELFNIVDNAYKNGEQIAVKVTDSTIATTLFVLAGVVCGLFLLAR